MVKRVSVVGSTGSIGKQTLDVLRVHPEFKLTALCAQKNAAALLEQAREFTPFLVGISDEGAAKELKNKLPAGVKLVAGADAAEICAAYSEADIVVNGVAGFAGTRPLFAALNAGKDVALANKESVVCAHTALKDVLKRGKGKILPVDSEQSALFQCLLAGKKRSVRRLVLTASGGPFRGYTREALKGVTPEQAAKHPTWSMGQKITVDSATLFNKGLEVMEASYLFDLPAEKIAVLVHPESVVHSMVEFSDGANIAQLSRPDMRLAILYALSYPNRAKEGYGALRLEELGALHFELPDTEAFPAIPLAYGALKEGNVLPIAYNAGNEVAVARFLRGELGFLGIAELVEQTMARMPRAKVTSLDDVLFADAEARRIAGTLSRTFT
ncbi:MAG: 1-deoxy-D-xylulose-5-phosphate reductoisomerase [Clostridiaceae bacterium]|nr:1-deoxy-D-xylulose-5-phosphate reductoisomerase [Eubacteriales bacterium]